MAEHQVAVETALQHYVSPCPDPSNVVVTNAYVKSTQADLALTVPFRMLSESEGGVVVLIMNSPRGQLPHYLMRSFGTQFGGSCPRGQFKKMSPSTGQLFGCDGG